MLKLSAVLSLLLALRALAADAPAPVVAPAATPAPDAGQQLQDELKQDADLLSSMTDAEYAVTAGRKAGDAAAADTAAADQTDPRLSRPTSLSLIYDTLASYEYHAA